MEKLRRTPATSLWIGFWAVGQPICGFMFWGNVVLTALAVLGMIYLANQTVNEDSSVQA